jgi:hypothetical protein
MTEPGIARRASERSRRAVAALLVMLALVGAAGVSEASQEQPRFSIASGLARFDGHPALVDVLVAIPPGADPVAATDVALRSAHAVPLNGSPAPDFTFTCLPICLRWPQFFDTDRRTNNFVHQLYNPTGDTTGGGFDALLNAEATWSAVSTSTFRYDAAGTTTSSGSAYDGQNVVSWLNEWPFDPMALAITITFFETATGFIVDSDVMINANEPWSADGSPSPEPTECPSAPPPPSGSPPPPPPPGAPNPVLEDCAPSVFDLESVLLHEDGHVAGLDHSADPSAVMYALYGGIRRALAQDDIDAISTLYPLRFRPIPPHVVPTHAHPSGPPS